MISCVILAGGEAPAEMQAAYGIRARHEVTFRGVSMLDSVVQALQGVGDEVVVVGAEAEGARSVPGGASFFESFQGGLAAARHDRVLMAGADLPFLTREAVEDFVGRCDMTAAINYSIADLAATTCAYPGVPRTALQLKDGEFTGGNLFLMQRSKLNRALPKVEKMYQARKSPLKLAQVVGVGTLFAMIKVKLIPGSTSIAEFEELISKALGERVRAIQTPYPEIAADFDNSSQVAWLKALEKREE